MILSTIWLQMLLGLDIGQHNLQLVFLNGCLSYGHVGILTAKGVKAVIATNVSIDDSEAIRLAATFYKQFFEKGRTLKIAFEMAEARVGGDNSFIIIVNPGELDKKPAIPPSWALFINSKHQEVMNWTLQDFVNGGEGISSEVEKPNQTINKVYNINHIVNAKF